MKRGGNREDIPKRAKDAGVREREMWKVELYKFFSGYLGREKRVGDMVGSLSSLAQEECGN